MHLGVPTTPAPLLFSRLNGSLGLPSTRRHGPTGIIPAGGHRDAKGAGASAIGGKAAGWGSSACLEKRRLWGLTPLPVNTWQEGIGKMEPGSSQGIQCQEAVGRKGDKKILFRHKKKPCLLSGWLHTGKGCSGRLRSLRPWRYSEPKWTQSWSSCWRLTLLHAWVLDRTVTRGAFQPPLFYDSINFIAERPIIYLDVLSMNSVSLPSLNAMKKRAKAILLSRAQLSCSLGILRLIVVIEIV